MAAMSGVLISRKGKNSRDYRKVPNDITFQKSPRFSAIQRRSVIYGEGLGLILIRMLEYSECLKSSSWFHPMHQKHLGRR
jgi:hypothetical protein